MACECDVIPMDVDEQYLDIITKDDKVEATKDYTELSRYDNYKDILLRFCQNKFGTTPNYKISETSGPPHNRTFNVTCFIQDIEYKYGKGKNKKDAEQIAAKETLKYYKQIK